MLSQLSDSSGLKFSAMFAAMLLLRPASHHWLFWLRTSSQTVEQAQPPSVVPCIRDYRRSQGWLWSQTTALCRLPLLMLDLSPFSKRFMFLKGATGVGMCLVSAWFTRWGCVHVEFCLVF